MEIYIAGPNSGAFSRDHAKQTPALYILESFYYISDWMKPYIKDEWNFLLDSGAFTFMENMKKTTDWDLYVERYAAFINELGVNNFFELDIDSVVGIKEVERLRAKLERLTNKRSIPVWHKSRGLDYWKTMCREYEYIAIGGIASQEIKRHEYKHFTRLLDIAKESQTRVHGLGFTSTEGLKKYRFDSVDSTAWIYGNRGGFIYHFDGKEMQKIYAPRGQRIDNRKTAAQNLNAWIQFQRYALNNL